MPTISFDITADEEAAILAVTKETAQVFLERNARVHVADCASKKKVADYSALGVPAQVAFALDADELDAVVALKQEKAAAKAAAIEAAKAIG